MFTSEKELVEKLVEELQQKYGTQYIVRELRGGNNIADIACTKEINRQNIVFDEYFKAYYYIHEIYNKKKVNLDKLNILNSKNNKLFFKFLSELEELGYIKIDGNQVKSIKKVDAVTTNFIAIEAKLSDWRSGLEQANRYKRFANEVYVALSEEYISKVDKQLFKENNIGLISVSKESLKIQIKAKKNKVEKLDIQYYIVDRFLEQFYKNAKITIMD